MDNKSQSFFQLKNYKIDRVHFVPTQNSEFYDGGSLSEERVKLGVRVRPPVFLRQSAVYRCGIDQQIVYLAKDTESELFTLEIGICGNFVVRTQGETPEDEMVKRIVVCQAPAVLSPYLRSATSVFLCGIGFPAYITPLINFFKLSESRMSELDIVEKDE